MKYSVVIPTYGNPHLLKNCLFSLRKHHGDTREVVVTDDGSGIDMSDLCAEYGAKWVPNDKNEGYPTNVNRGIGRTSGEWVFVVNSDIQFTEPLFGPMLSKTQKESDVVVAGCRLMYPNGTIQHAGIFKHGTLFGHFGRGETPNQNAQWGLNYFAIAVTGAIHLVKRSWWDECKYDDRFFLANEDVLYCLEAWKRGKKVFYVGEVSAIHLEGATRGATEAEKLKKNELWTIKEAEGHEKFAGVVENTDFDPIYQSLCDANSKRCVSSAPLVVERTAALGDVIYTTGIVREIKRKYPTLNIIVKTMCTDVYMNNNNVIGCSYDAISTTGKVLCLDQAYELSPNEGILEAYCSVAGLSPKDCYPELHAKKDDEYSLAAKFSTVENEPYVVVHMGTSWKNKTIPMLVWARLVSELSKKYKVVVVGKAPDFKPKLNPSAIDMTDKLNLQELYLLIKRAKLCICPDSGVLAVAQCTDTPTIATFTCARHDHIIIKSNVTPIYPDIDCYGCLHRQKAPANYCECPANKDYECIRWFTSDRFVSKVMELIK